MKKSVLLVDDEEALLRTLARQLSARAPEIDIHTTTDPAAALELVRKIRPSIVISDLSIDESIGPESGLTLVGDILTIDPTCRVIVLTGHTDDEFGIAAIKVGAASFIRKPPNSDHLYALIIDGILFSDLKRENLRLMATRPSAVSTRLRLISHSQAMHELLGQAEFAADHALPLLISGETGVGKGVLARAIHEASSRRGPFIRFQPSLSSSEIVSSELFGHERGAFTGAIATRVGLLEEADQGTLFIDEVDELPNDTQVLLLEALQERRFKRLGGNREIASDFRVIAATNRPVGEAVKTGKLRADFLHRIAQHRLELPPLRKRQEDLELLAEGFISTLAQREKLAVSGLAPSGLNKLRSYTWPGNIRELQATIELATYRAASDERRFIEADDIYLNCIEDTSINPGSFRAQVDAFEQKLILDALNRTGGNQSQAAKELGLDRSSFRRLLTRTG